MSIIRATVRNGRIETEEPINLPEGTELMIPVPGGDPEGEEGWDTSPEAIAAWLSWEASLEPLVGSGAEEAEAEEWLKRCGRYESRRLSEDAGGLFP